MSLATYVRTPLPDMKCLAYTSCHSGARCARIGGYPVGAGCGGRCVDTSACCRLSSILVGAPRAVMTAASGLRTCPFRSLWRRFARPHPLTSSPARRKGTRQSARRGARRAGCNNKHRQRTAYKTLISAKIMRVIARLCYTRHCICYTCPTCELWRRAKLVCGLKSLCTSLPA
jgi:hypothetical protein